MSCNSGAPHEQEWTRCSPVCGDVGWSQVSIAFPEPAPACCSLWGKAPWIADRELRETKERPHWDVHPVPGIFQNISWPLMRTTGEVLLFKMVL